MNKIKLPDFFRAEVKQHIKISNRGPSFKINGESSNAQIAKDIILRIYDDLDECGSGTEMQT